MTPEQLEPIDKHLPRYERRAIGKSPRRGGNRNLYATAVRCSCGWEDRNNGHKQRDAIRVFGQHHRDQDARGAIGTTLEDVDFEDFADTSDWQLMIDSAAAYRVEPPSEKAGPR